VNKLIAILSVLFYILVKTGTSFSVYETLSLTLFIYYLLTFIDNLGKKLVILDVVLLNALFICLVMPIVGYHHFTFYNRLARSWWIYMRVPSDTYYSFMFPAMIAMIVGFKIPFFYRKHVSVDQTMYMQNAKAYVGQTKWQGLILVAIGGISSLLKGMVPAALSHVLFLSSHLMFVGVFYCLYSQFPNKRTIMILVFGFLIVSSILGGMFGELVYMGTMTVILVLLGRKISFINKFSVMTFGLFLILIIQTVKPLYREKVWRQNYQGNQLALFAGLIQDVVARPSTMLSDEMMLFKLYSRFNQGQVISRVIESVPKRRPYANGETLFLSIAGSIIPRFLWADKPQAGGAYNFQRFLGVKLQGYSIGLSPFGEAWGNFGKYGGIAFMFFFGLLYNFFYAFFFKIARTVPSLVLWCPYLFFYAINIETDFFTMVNSFTKAALFTFIIYKLYPKVFGQRI
jgi:hypothetical protein